MGGRMVRLVEAFGEVVETGLLNRLPLSSQRGTERFNEAVHFAVFPGGKRWRPFLTLLGGLVAGVSADAMIPAACALEFLHTSSIIIDDLPAMDDATIRRGKPALHLEFDESTALLASLALLNRSYGLLGETCHLAGNPGCTGRLVALASDTIGANGMIGGQVVDLIGAKGGLCSDRLSSRNLKTTSLTELMMIAGAVAANTGEREVRALRIFGNALGSAYQICDDLLDADGDEKSLGKNSGQDKRHERPSFCAEYRPTDARRLAVDLLDKGIGEMFRTFGESAETLILADAAFEILKFDSAGNRCFERSESVVS